MKNLKFFKVKLQPLQKNHIDALGTSYYFPVNFWDGFSVMNKSYSVNDALALLYDLAPFSTKQYTTDMLEMRSRTHLTDYQTDINGNLKFNSTMINLILPEAFNGIVPI